MRADNSAHLQAAARARAESTRQRAHDALRRIAAVGQEVSFNLLAREAKVSRSWLYTQADLCEQIRELRSARQQAPNATAPPERQRASTDSLRRRLEAATERTQALEAENRQLREALARALGTERAARLFGDSTRRDTPGKRDSKLIGPC